MAISSSRQTGGIPPSMRFWNNSPTNRSKNSHGVHTRNRQRRQSNASYTRGMSQRPQSQSSTESCWMWKPPGLTLRAMRYCAYRSSMAVVPHCSMRLISRNIQRHGPMRRESTGSVRHRSGTARQSPTTSNASKRCSTGRKRYVRSTPTSISRSWVRLDCGWIPRRCATPCANMAVHSMEVITLN